MASQKAGKNRKIFFSIITLIIGLVVALILAEILLRLLGYAPAFSRYTVNEKQFQQIPGMYEPHPEYLNTGIPELPHRLTTNTLGYRGEDFSRQKPFGETRILVTGDSFVYGVYVDDEKTLPAQLEQQLKSTCPDVRVINAGWVAGTIVGEAAMIKRGLVLEPDLVVLVFFENDVANLASPLWDDIAKNRKFKSRFPLSVIYPILRNTAIWNFSVRLAGILRAEREVGIIQDNKLSGKKVSAVTPQPSQVETELKVRYKQELVNLHNMLQHQGIPFVLVVYPSSEAVEKGFSAILQWAIMTGKEAGIPTLDLLPFMSEGLDSIQAGYLLPYDPHPSPLGHAIAAKALSEHLLRIKLLRETCNPAVKRANQAVGNINGQ